MFPHYIRREGTEADTPVCDLALTPDRVDLWAIRRAGEMLR